MEFTTEMIAFTGLLMIPTSPWKTPLTKSDIPRHAEFHPLPIADNTRDTVDDTLLIADEMNDVIPFHTDTKKFEISCQCEMIIP